MNNSHQDDDMEQTISELQAHNEILVEALQKINNWNTHSTKLAVDFGSNGVRDYYRRHVQIVLSNPNTAKQTKIQKARDGVVEAVLNWQVVDTDDDEILSCEADIALGVSLNHLNEVMGEQ